MVTGLQTVQEYATTQSVTVAVTPIPPGAVLAGCAKPAHQGGNPLAGSVEHRQVHVLCLGQGESNDRGAVERIWIAPGEGELAWCLGDAVNHHSGLCRTEMLFRQMEGIDADPTPGNIVGLRVDSAPDA